jgi:hypothetical protein
MDPVFVAAARQVTALLHPRPGIRARIYVLPGIVLSLDDGDALGATLMPAHVIPMRDRRVRPRQEPQAHAPV